MASSASRRKLGPSPSPSSVKSLTSNHKHHHHASSNQFRPGVVVVVGSLVIIFSIIFLILLYAKHCKRTTRNASPSVPTARRNSGVDRSIVESLPLFCLASIGGQREGLECAVCLGKFNVDEHLRLLPKCNHIFHVECVDTWLDAHSTCPLCRNQVDPEDVLIVPDFINIAKDSNPCKPEEVQDVDREEEQDLDENSTACGLVRVSGRHSSAEERSSSTVNTLQMLAQKPPPRRRKSDIGHEIVLSGDGGEGNVGLERWSDMGPSDLLLLRADMMMTSPYARNGRSVAVNPRSQSDITCLNRREASSGRRRTAEGRTLRRWMNWIGEHDGRSGATNRLNSHGT